MGRLTVDVNITATSRPRRTFDDAPPVRLTAPLLVRLLEWAREEARSDVALHEAVDRIVAAGPRTLDSADYEGALKFPRA